MMSVKCEEPIDELIVQVWLLTRVHYPKCAYGPYCKFNPNKNGVYILVEVSI